MPESTHTRVDVITGCHKSAELFNFGHSHMSTLFSPVNHHSRLTYHYVTNFLRGCGTEFNCTFARPSELIQQLEQAKEFVVHSPRDMHYGNQLLVRPDKPYLNRLHKELVTNMVATDLNDCMLSIQIERPSSHPVSYYFSSIFSSTPSVPSEAQPQYTLTYQAEIVPVPQREAVTDREDKSCSIM